jgi:hypothetical protein
MEIKNVAARKRPPLVILILDSMATRLSNLRTAGSLRLRPVHIQKPSWACT